MPRTAMSPAERFFQSFTESPDGCWLWHREINPKSYGILSALIDGKHRRVRAHRFAWELLRGPIPEGLEVDHLCRVRHCVNPDHLEPVTRRVNQLRGYGVSGIAARKTHCQRGHDFDRRDSQGARFCSQCRRGGARERRLRAKNQQRVAQPIYEQLSLT